MGISLSSSNSASQAVTSIDLALDKITDNRKQFAGILAELQRAADMRVNMTQRLELARQQIPSFEAAHDVLGIAKSQISKFSSVSIFAQANSGPQNAFTLLQDQSIPSRFNTET